MCAIRPLRDVMKSTLFVASLFVAVPVPAAATEPVALVVETHGKISPAPAPSAIQQWTERRPRPLEPRG